MAEDEKDPRIEIEEPGSDTFAGLVDRLGRENLSRSPWDGTAGPSPWSCERRADGSSVAPTPSSTWAWSRFGGFGSIRPAAAKVSGAAF